LQSRNPGIKPRQSRDFGIGKVGRDPGIPGYGIPGLQSLLITFRKHLKSHICFNPPFPLPSDPSQRLWFVCDHGAI